MMSRNSVPTIPLDDVQLASTAELAALDESDEQLVTTLIASNYQDTARRWLKQSNAFQRETYVEALNLVQSAEVYREMPTKGRRPLGNTFKERFCYASTYMVSFEERDARVAPPVIERSYAHQQTGRLARPKTVSSTYRDEYLTKSKPDYFRACPADIFKLAGKYLSQAARDRAPTLNKLHQLDLVRALQSLERFAAADPLRAQTARISRDFYNTTYKATTTGAQAGLALMRSIDVSSFLKPKPPPPTAQEVLAAFDCPVKFDWCRKGQPHGTCLYSSKRRAFNQPYC
eukprot:TRINITY_DN819_c0_g1_i1.p1 TRINITY_DN819_c0_g1~~TRINITY_DN819_c0_g1_i1.p1  ORF type:complete len:288 (+),score=55.88 TRINITY_DN819_c0_g1_i1:71-934(+)